MHLALVVLYGYFALVAGLNLALMRRPGRAPGPAGSIAYLIPARNEAENLRALLPLLDGPVFVFDDESEDGTAEIARSLGAKVVQAREPLPKGWTGKNRACHELALFATQSSDADWLVFLDADVRPKPGFADGIRDLTWASGGTCGVITGFLQVLPGRGIEPLFLIWVGWVLLALNPFGLVCRTGLGHNRFTNGQFHAWRRDVYLRLRPNEAVRGAILEDIKMGRLCAREGVRVEVANVSNILSVKMYETWRETLDGMSKNSYEIVDSVPGSLALALGLLAIAWGWALAGPMAGWALGLFLLSGVMCTLTVRAKPWGIVLLPVGITIGAVTVIRSVLWRRRGQVKWKGRTY